MNQEEIVAALEDTVAFEPGQVPGVAFGVSASSCKHERVSTVATGPDDRRYLLVSCLSCASPTFQVRAWYTKRANRWGPWRNVWIGERHAL